MFWNRVNAGMIVAIRDPGTSLPFTSNPNASFREILGMAYFGTTS
jgi:hypothetical protein